MNVLTVSISVKPTVRHNQNCKFDVNYPMWKVEGIYE